MLNARCQNSEVHFRKTPAPCPLDPDQLWSARRGPIMHRQSVVAHRGYVLLPDMAFLAVHPSEFNVIKSIPRRMPPIERRPEIKIAQRRIGLHRQTLRSRLQRLKMWLADQAYLIPSAPQRFADGGNTLLQFRARRVRAVARGIHACEDACPRRRVGRVGTVRPIETHTRADESVEVWRFYLRGDSAPLANDAGRM